jgi:hypothetical protein
MANKKTKKRLASGMTLYTLTLHEGDLRQLRWVLEDFMSDQQWIMDNPNAKATPDEKMEDWLIARDFKVDALKIIQAIDKCCPKLKKEE